MRLPEQVILKKIDSMAAFHRAYGALMVLSAAVCTFGLLANSPATVIGAATMAPLTGPILGISLGLVRGEMRRFRRSLLSEGVGTLICLVTGLLLARFFGPEQLDYSQQQIAANFRPTLLDMAIGFAAGLAGAYASVDKRVSESVAGVAIAVTLVPPLCTAGLCLGGGLYSEAFGAVMLFLANFVAIQLASAVVFTLAGLSQWAELRRNPSLVRALALNLLLLGGTAWFLERQLRQLMQERYAQRVTREVVNQALANLPGARLESTRLRLQAQRLQIDLLVRAPEELTVGFVQSLRDLLQRRLPETIDLRVGTALSSYVAPEGRLFAPLRAEPSAEDVFRTDAEWALQEAIKQFSQVELVNFRSLRLEPPAAELLVSLRSPYVFESELVGKLQQTTQQFLSQRGQRQYQLKLTVRTTVIYDYTEDGPLQFAPEKVVGEAELLRQKLEARALKWLHEQVEKLPEVWLVEARASLSGSELSLVVSLQMPTRPRAGLWKQWRDRLQKELSVPVRLEVSWIQGQHVEVVSK
ncbi:MAG: DUF389 domain-containing protein [Candidatus Eremiobacteraeota bacterium]|nr:DUF389 domain-containing protein [Candidatus Eremiobacteraeota bacterium]MCW5866522.1 DUF389 domain-containing protein [Candidatus Eremiobacteraeota bacterium]